MAETYVVYSEKPNAFLIILETILRFGFENDPNSPGFIRYFDQLPCILQNVVLPTVFDVFQCRETVSFYSGKPNAFLILFEAKTQKELQKYQ